MLRAGRATRVAGPPGGQGAVVGVGEGVAGRAERTDTVEWQRELSYPHDDRGVPFCEQVDQRDWRAPVEKPALAPVVVRLARDRKVEPPHAAADTEPEPGRQRPRRYEG